MQQIPKLEACREKEFAQRNNLPTEAVMGGAETMYPEFRKKIQGKYTPPTECKKDCR